MSQINDQNILLKAQLSAAGGHQAVITQNGASSEHLEQQMQLLNNTIAHQNTKINFYESENARLNSELELTKQRNHEETAVNQVKSEFTEKIEKMNKDQEDLLELLADQDNKLREYRKRLKTLGQDVDGSEDDE